MTYMGIRLTISRSVTLQWEWVGTRDAVGMGIPIGMGMGIKCNPHGSPRAAVAVGMGIPMGMGMGWVWGLKCNPHGSPGWDVISLETLFRCRRQKQVMK